MTILDSLEAEVEVLDLAQGLDTTDLEGKDDDTLISEARWHVEQARFHHGQSLLHGQEAGRRLLVLHARTARRGRSGEFSNALVEEVGISRSHAYNLMELARPENVQRVGQLAEDPDASIRQALEMLHAERREERREAARAERQARMQFPAPVDLPANFNIDVAEMPALPIPDGLADLIVTSPPYGLGMAYHESDDSEGYETYLTHALEWSDELFRVAGPQGRLCLNVPLDISHDGGYFAPKPIYADWVGALKEAGWRYRTTIVWNEDNITRTTARGSVDSPNSPHAIARVEMIAVMYKGMWNLERQGQSADITHDEWLDWTNGLWTFPGASPISPDHCPAPFPEELPRRCIRLFSFPNDVILDPFVGSGTTGVVAYETGRQFYGFDRSALYIEQARERVSSAIARLRTNGHMAQPRQPASEFQGAAAGF